MKFAVSCLRVANVRLVVGAYTNAKVWLDWFSKSFLLPLSKSAKLKNDAFTNNTMKWLTRMSTVILYLFYCMQETCWLWSMVGHSCARGHGQYNYFRSSSWVSKFTLISVLAGLSNSAIMPVQRVQNVAARLILNVRMSDHVTPALRLFYWLPVDVRVNYKRYTMMHSIDAGQSPIYSTDMVCLIAANMIVTHDTAVGERAFSYAGPHTWNTLPPSFYNITDSVDSLENS